MTEKQGLEFQFTGLCNVNRKLLVFCELLLSEQVLWKQHNLDKAVENVFDSTVWEQEKMLLLKMSD